MAKSTASSQEDGIHLTSDHDVLLLKISRYFKTIDEVRELAIYLFQGSPTGGEAFVAQLEKDSTVVNKAYKVLDGWRTRYYEKAYGRRLYEVLSEPDVNPKAAMECKSELWPENSVVTTGHAVSSGTTKTGQRGPKLKALFHKISKKFLKIRQVYELADGLFDDGGAWAKSKTAPGAVPVSEDVAYGTLEYWFEHSQEEPTGSKLHAEIMKVRPDIAREFEKELFED